MPGDFPYKIITKPSDVQLSRENGYRGWRRDSHRRLLHGPNVVADVIPRSAWRAQIASLGNRNLATAYPLPAKDQNGLGYCWVYGSTRAVEVERAHLGLAPISLCPESLGGPLTGWRNEGGYASEAFNAIETAGIANAELCPSPHALNPRLWNPRWAADARSHEVATWDDIEQTDRAPTFDELISCLLSPVPVAIGLDWWGHLVCALAAISLPPETACDVNTPDGGKIGVLFQNSWGADWPTPGANGLAVLVESLATPDGAAAPTIAT